MSDMRFRAIVVVSIVVTIVAAIEAFETRGYFAMGGEYFFLLMPFFAYVIDSGILCEEVEDDRG